METLGSRITTQELGQMAGFERKQESCSEHGPYEALVIRGNASACPECFDRQREQEEIESQKRFSQEHQQRIAGSLLRKAAIPPRFASKRLDNFTATLPGQRKALSVASEYVLQFDGKTGQSLIFCGGVGSGKTHLSVGIAHDLIECGYLCIFTSVIGAIRSVKETYSRDSQITEREAIDNLIQPDLLILDEVGVQFGSDTEKLILFEIINGRYEAMRSTILISNLAMDSLTEYLGERVVDRLREDGGRMVVFDWPSFRRQAA